MARKDDQFDTGFGSGGTFGGSSAGAAKSQAQAPAGGEFASGFGGGTNAVSQIFRDGGAGGDDKRRKMTLSVLMGVALVGMVYGGYVLFFEESTNSESAAVVATPAANPTAEAAATPADVKVSDAAAEDAEEADDGAEDGAEDEEEVEELATESVAPSSSGSYTYNEIGGGPIVKAAAGTPIEVSRRQDFSEMYITGSTNGAGELRIPNPPPGKVYWRVSGKTEVTEISVLPAPRIGISMKMGASIGASDTLQWNANGDVGHYRLEFASDAAFANIAHSFSTNKTQLALSGVNPGTYFVRVGGLNVASGRWEFTQGSSVEVK